MLFTSLLKDFQQATDLTHPLRAYLITPVQRITRYQLLLKEILKYTTLADQESTCIEVNDFKGKHFENFLP